MKRQTILFSLLLAGALGAHGSHAQDIDPQRQRSGFLFFFALCRLLSCSWTASRCVEILCMGISERDSSLLSCGLPDRMGLVMS